MKQLDPLASIRARAAIVAARVQEVICGDVPSLFLYGPGGMGKTHAVTGSLDAALGPGKWEHHNSYMTARALLEILYVYRDAIHVFEDMESLYKDKKAGGVLRSACGSAKGRPRIVTWKTNTATFEFPFTGGIIIVSNEDLRDNGIFGAIASRMKPLKWDLSREELIATIRDIASRGFVRRGKKTSAKECQEVAEYVIEHIGRGTYKVDLRTFCDHALPTYAGWKRAQEKKEDWAKLTHWTSIVKTKIEGEPVIEGRSDRIDRERVIAQQCYRDGNNTTARLTLWRSRTGRGKQAFYDRLKEAEAKATKMFS